MIDVGVCVEGIGGGCMIEGGLVGGMKRGEEALERKEGGF